MADPNGQDPPGTERISEEAEVLNTPDTDTTQTAEPAGINGPDPPGTP